MAIHGELEFVQIGFLAADPTFRQNGDDMVVNFRVITTETWRDRVTKEERTRSEGFNYELWGPSAEHFKNRMSSGSQVYVKGQPRNDSYEKEGVTHYGVRIRVSRWRALDRQEKNDQPVSGAGGDDRVDF
ncbi:Single-stranded DNA-binding protein [Paraburkholderia domus]|uniref:single-stranded DNA-binding protein n=1 Tax=Paraburkholderia domus TaxID=2793075 RepID=UPI001912F645|nr:single-stranded DNA-binding protein [Paraburkholderia domus]MBK5052905.1 single-stranded DNA-binding protein [Burkholderia sp. R-70006]CAE6822569.1 Single-stranded DNA-binding protein [Paraburkholderia domus]